MMMKKKSNAIPCAAFLTIVAIVMYLLNLFTPWFCDDWHYPFIFGTHEHIRSLGDIFISQCRHYFHFNGRFIVHCFVQLFAGLTGKGIFNVLNALMFVTLLYAIGLVTTSDKNDRFKVIVLSFVLLFFLMPGFKYVFLWLSGSCNYLWTGTAILFFIYLMEKDQFSVQSRLLLFAIGIFCGWSNEALALGLGASYFLYFFFNRKEFTSHRKWLMIGFGLGLVALVLSPGALGRASRANSGEFQMMARLANLGNLRFFFLMLVFLLAKVVTGPQAAWRWIKQEQVLLTAAGVSLAFIYMTGDYHAQSRFGIELYSLLLALRLINWKCVSNLVVAAAGVATLAYGGYVASVCAQCDKANREELSRITGSHCIVPTTQPIPITSFLHRYALDYAGFFVDDNKHAGEHIWISSYYGYTDVVFLPQIFIDDLKAHHEAYDGKFHTIDKLPFFAMRLPEFKDYRFATVTFSKPQGASIIDRIVAKLKGDVDYYYADARVVKVVDEHYVLVARFHPSQDNQLQSIIIEGPDDNDKFKYNF